MSKIIQKSFKSDPKNLPEIEEFILESLKSFSLTEEFLHKVEMAVSEASANSIHHGNKNDRTKSIHITITLEENYFTISFQDEGNGFVLNEVPDPTKPENILKGSGRGIHIMKNLVDDLSYEFSNSGTAVTLKFLI